jgi:hypothetical protein
MNVICPRCFIGISLLADWEALAVRCRRCRQRIPLPPADGEDLDEEDEELDGYD